MKPIFLALAFCAAAQAAPTLFYSDLESGPNTGGRLNNGALVCVSGTRFGSARGTSTITVGGGAVAEYLLWSDSKACFQLGAAAATGNIVLTVNGSASNALPFTVRSALIYFAGSTADIGGSPGAASDANTGDFDHPVSTIRACKNKITSGSGAICYVRGGLSQTGLEANYSAVQLDRIGTLSAPLTMAAWAPDPVRPIIGDYNSTTQTLGFGTRPAGDHWVIVGFDCRGRDSAIQLLPVPTDFRIVNNTLQCPASNASAGCLNVAWTDLNPDPNQSYKVYGNEVLNSGCGEYITSGLDNSAGLSGQSIQYTCPSFAQSGTLSMSGGNTLTITGATFGWNTSLYPGVHIQVDTDGDGVYEESVLATATATTVTLESNSFVTTTFSGRPWRYKLFTAGKLFHSTYFGSDTNGVDFGWNHIHNNSAIHGFNSHSTPVGTYLKSITSIAAGSPPRMTLSSAFPGITTGAPGLVNGQRLDIVGNSTLPDRDYYVSLPTPGDYATVDLYLDKNLAAPATLASPGSGGNAARSGFGIYNMLVHDNYIHDQNGACISIALADPDRGAIKIYNNVMHDCGTGPNVTVGGTAFPGVYMLNAPDRPDANLYGTGTVEYYNNTMYNVSKYATPSSGSVVGAICMNITPKALYFRARNNIFYQPNGIAFSTCPSVAKITGFNNIWFGTSTSTIPANVVASITTDPQFVSVGARNLQLQSTSPAIDAGATTEATQDYLAIARPQGSTWDLGAYEYVPGGTPLDPLVITTPSLPDGVVGGTYSMTMAASGGTGTKVWGVTVNAASGLSMSSGGTFSGIPLVSGTFDVTARVTDSSGSTTQDYLITIADAPLDPNAVTVTATAAAASAVVRYGAATLAGNQTCTVAMRQGSTTIQTYTDSGGRPSRVAGFTGLAAGAYTPVVTCTPFGSGTGSNITVAAATGLTASVPVTGYARTEIAATKMRVEWGYTSALSGTPVTVTCSGTCSVTIPSVATGGVVWVRLSYLNSSDATVAAGEAFPVIVQ